MPRYFRFDEVKIPTNKRIRHIIVHYVRWVEIFGYCFCAIVAAGISVCWFYHVDELAVEKDLAKTVVKPLEYSLKASKEAVVTRVTVSDFQKVKAGEPLAEIVDAPAFVAGWKSTQQLEAMVKGLNDLIGASTPADATPTPAPADAATVPGTTPGPTPPGLEMAVRERDAAQARMDAWRAMSLSRFRPQVLKAPADGEVMGAKDLQGKVVAADGEVLKVVDFAALRLKVKLSGTNVERVRVGQPVKIEIQPNYGTETAVRGDIRLSTTQRQRVQFQDILDTDDTKKLLTERWKGKRLTSKEDKKWGLSIPATEASEVEMVTTRLQFDRLPGSAAGTNRVDPEPLERLKLEGQVIEGSHTATFRVKEKDPAPRAEVMKRIEAKLRDKETQTVVGNPLRSLAAKARGREFEGDLVDLRLRGFGEPTIFLKVKAALPEPAKAERGFTGKHQQWEADAKKGIENAVETERTERLFEGVVQLVDAPQLLQDRLRGLAQQDPPIDLKSKVSVVVGKRRLALVLFRQ
ncbi:MAG: HlyD family efflux transporter periplasmic adaptor subunit [Armatimonadetes bacterium]|nr:HlyD family efflux transporter periplasmic adaptor subunit [Armatimonadota bacterium]